jgi:eukaryotic-like serine/threonine-protein kinase
VEQGEQLGGRYRLVERIGAGGMGEVWRATDEILGRAVAIKTMLPSIMGDPDFSRRFLGEAKAMAALRHPGVVAIHDFHSGPDGAFLVMEYVQSESLGQVLRRVGKLDWVSTLNLIAQVADALQAAHDAGLVHRDVKPANLLVRPDGSVVLTDFGIARIADQTSLTTPGALLGTPSYLSPEQVMGQPATRLSDVYALGVVAYECLSGQRPFSGDNPYAIALQRVHEQPRTIVSDAPRAVLETIEVALATDPAYRWQSAADFAQAVRAAAAPTAPTAPAGAVGRVSAPPPRPQQHTSPTARPALPTQPGDVTPTAQQKPRRIWPVLVAAAAMLALTGGLWAVNMFGDTDRGGTDPRHSTTVALPPDMAACGELLCPTKPLCWNGTVAIAGKASPLERLECDGTHSWETFVAAPISAEAVGGRQGEMIERPEIAAVCSAAKLAERSRDPKQTAGWRLEAWPVELADGSWVYHCMATPAEGDPPGAAMRTGD